MMIPRRSVLSIFLLFVSMALLGACGGEQSQGDPVVPEVPVLTTVTVTPPSGVLEIGDTLRLSAVALDQNDEPMTGVAITWASEDEDVVEVSATGLVSAVGPGAVEVTATAGTVAGSADLSVDLEPVPGDQLSSGMGHTCALDTSGAAFCWGAGGLGLGSVSLSDAPAPVSGGLAFDHISASGSHTCGLTTDARVMCWGDNGHGQVTGVAGGSVGTPTQVTLTGAVTSVSTGYEFSCALISNGDAICWGRNNEAQLGRGSTSPSAAPGLVSGDVDFIQLGLGRAHGCGLTVHGVVHCWGRNATGGVGDGGTSMALAPVRIASDERFLQVDAGDDGSCAVSVARTVVCWGWGSTYLHTDAPTEVAGLTDIGRIEAGHYGACAVTLAGQASCWGRNVAGVLGSGDDALDGSEVPLPVAGSLSFDELTVGGSIACGRAAGQVYCWGSNQVGSLGLGHTTSEPLPVEVSGGITWSEVRAGSRFSCGLDGSADIHCWGAGYTPLGEPQAIGGTGPFSELTVGYRHACALDSQGKAHCWGYNFDGQLGDGTNTSRATPTPVATDSSFVAISAGAAHTCGVVASGATFCWGDYNSNFGNPAGPGGGATNVPVPGGVGVSLAAIALGERHSCGLDMAGAAHCWGVGLSGQLGNGDNDAEIAPAPVSGGHTFESISAAHQHSCGIDVSGAAWCWGGVGGRLGAGSTSGSNVPVAVVGGRTYSQIAAGVMHTCALESTGDVWCWGYAGALGTGATSASTVPVMAQLPSSAVDVSAGLGYGFDSATRTACAVLDDSSAYCWGSNAAGQLGVPVTPHTAVPLPVLPFP